MPSISVRTSNSSTSPLALSLGTLTDRFGNSSSAFAATSRLRLSRTGIGLVPRLSASLRRLTTCPGTNTPDISP